MTNATVNAGTYTLSESGGPTGYAAGSWSCTAGTLTGASLVLPLNTSATCTINNNDQPAHLTLVKTVTNDNGGTAVPTAWTLAAAGPTPISGATGSAAVTNATVNAGTYTLSESGGPAGYTASTWSCTAGTLTGASLVLPLNTSATCTINNNDQQARLTLIKTVTNDNGGTAVPTAWTLAAAGPTPLSGATGSAGVTAAPVSAGSYVLSESGGPAGYAAGAWICTGGTVTAGAVSVVLGADVVCTINNNDQPATLTLVKTVTNDNGGTAVPTAWTLAAAGPTPISGATGSAPVTNATVNAGTYTLSESGGPAGYTASTWSCTAGTLTGASLVLPLNTSATCTINNNDQPATLTLVKTVTNDNGGTRGTHCLDLGRCRADADQRRHRVRPGHRRSGQLRHVHAVGVGRAVRIHGRRLVVRWWHPDRGESGSDTRGLGHLHDQQQRPAGHVDPRQDGHQRQRR